MLLYCIRHGNTFEAHEEPRWVGAKEDLPLTVEGEQQIERLAAYLRGQGVSFKRILAAPLKRTWRTAEILAQGLEFQGELQCEPRLMELDYGSWAGRSNRQIEGSGGREALQLWTQECLWPLDAAWSPPEEVVQQEVRALLRELGVAAGEAEKIALVSSNGRLRYFARECLEGSPLNLMAGQDRLGTGRFGVLELKPEGRNAVIQWNVAPG